MRLTDPLNDIQLKVLRWIADGCPNDPAIGRSYKVTAHALQDRRLVEVDRRSGGWSATVTDRGQHLLDHGVYPPADDRPGRPQRTSVSKTGSRSPVGNERADAGAALRDRRTSSSASKQRRLPRTEQIVADVVAAGGRLEFEPDDRDESYQKLVELVRHVNRFGKAPVGKRLAVERVRRDGDHWIYPRGSVLLFENGPAGMDAPLEPVPVPVPAEVRRYHPAVSTLRKERNFPASSTNARRWRILHGLATEAERRGYTVKAHKLGARQDYRGKPERWDPAAHVGR